MGAGQAAAGQPAAGQPAELGTDFVPQSPEVTAQQIAGAPALAQAAAAQAAAPPGQGQSPGRGQMPGKSPAPGQGEAQSPMPGEASPTASKGGAAKAGQSANNQPPPQGDLQLAPAAEGDSRGEKAEQDSTAAALKFENEPWFAKLPPSLRGAIQSKARGKAPRGYEERLRRYFESVD